MIYFINNYCYFYFCFIKEIIYYFIYLIFLSRILKLIFFPSESPRKYFNLDTFRFSNLISIKYRISIKILQIYREYHYDVLVYIIIYI